jgi:hypothetical protein
MMSARMIASINRAFSRPFKKSGFLSIAKNYDTNVFSNLFGINLKPLNGLFSG